MQSCGTQSQVMHLHYNSCTTEGSGIIAEQGSRKSQRDQEVAVRLCLLEMSDTTAMIRRQLSSLGPLLPPGIKVR